MVSIAAGAAKPSTSEGLIDYSITECMISYLRKEAALADEKAKQLRKEASEIAQKFGITEDAQENYELDPTELPPLDERGMPKYKGKKRGRKPKIRKRKMKADRPKRKHTGYTFFMQENYPGTKVSNPDLSPKELISLVAKQWKNLGIEAKNEWKERAAQASEQVAEGDKTSKSKTEAVGGSDSESAPN